MAILNLNMLFILFLTNSTVNVILNALAIQFVSDFDEELSCNEWFDPGRRYLKAGAMEILLRGELLLEPLVFPELLCKMFDIDFATYTDQVKGPIYDPILAKQDEVNPKFMSSKDKLYLASAKISHKQK